MNQAGRSASLTRICCSPESEPSITKQCSASTLHRAGRNVQKIGQSAETLSSFKFNLYQLIDTLMNVCRATTTPTCYYINYIVIIVRKQCCILLGGQVLCVCVYFPVVFTPLVVGPTPRRLVYMLPVARCQFAAPISQRMLMTS